jgi:hypothetical protein
MANMAHPVTRLEALKNRSTDHFIYRKLYGRLNPEDRTFLEGFIRDNDHLNAAEFEHKANRLFVDTRRTHASLIIVELLLVVNTASFHSKVSR